MAALMGGKSAPASAAASMNKHDSRTISADVPARVPDGPLYFVGVGGAGMSALAHVLAARGRPVAGADPGIAPAVHARLEAAGVRVFTAHDAANLEDAAALIVSDAVPDANPEVTAARERGLPVLRRPELLGALASGGRSIAVSGTHGKTTTTGMVASILLAAGLDPTVFLGGDLAALGGNARAGKSDVVVAEACEAYDGFLYLHPHVAVVLNVEADHLDYHGDEAHVIASFERFVGQVGRGGTVIVCADDTKALNLLRAVNDGTAISTYALHAPDADADVVAADVDTNTPQPTFTLVRFGEPLGRVRLHVPGRHNVLNALAAASVGLVLGVPVDNIVAGLEAFTGTGRRFEIIGEARGVLIVDDYAHHPTELRATLGAARSAYPDRRIVAVFQPHLPSRTRDLMDDFAFALAENADAVYLTDIYLAREQSLPGVTSTTLAAQVQAAKSDLPVAHVADKNDLPARLESDVRPGDLVLTLGAGDIRTVATDLLARLQEPVKEL